MKLKVFFILLFNLITIMAWGYDEPERVRISLPVEALGGNNVGGGIGIAFAHRRLEWQLQGGYSSYDDLDTYSITVGTDLSHRIRLLELPMLSYIAYYGPMVRYNHFMNTDNSGYQDLIWYGMQYGFEYAWKYTGIYIEVLQFQQNFAWDWPDYSLAAGMKLWL